MLKKRIKRRARKIEATGTGKFGEYSHHCCSIKYSSLVQTWHRTNALDHQIYQLLTLFELFTIAVWKRTCDDVNFSIFIDHLWPQTIACRDLTQQRSGVGELYVRTSDSIRE